MTQEYTEIVRFTMRMEKELYNKIVKSAKQNRRSINNEVAFRLVESLKLD